MLVAILRIEYYLFVRQLEDINFYLTSECNHSIFVINFSIQRSKIFLKLSSNISSIAYSRINTFPYFVARYIKRERKRARGGWTVDRFLWTIGVPFGFLRGPVHFYWARGSPMRSVRGKKEAAAAPRQWPPWWIKLCVSGVRQGVGGRQYHGSTIASITLSTSSLVHALKKTTDDRPTEQRSWVSSSIIIRLDGV